jgi:hypothetical protein
MFERPGKDGEPAILLRVWPLAANAGLLLPATLAHHLGLKRLVESHLDLGRAVGRANVEDELLTLVLSALAGGDCGRRLRAAIASTMQTRSGMTKRRESPGSDSWRRIVPRPASPTWRIYKRADGYTVGTRLAFHPQQPRGKSARRAGCGMSGRVESVPGRKDQPSVEPQESLAGPDDLDAYLARNLSASYRLTVLVTDDPIKSGILVRAAVVSVWSTSRAATVGELDLELRRRLEEDLEAAVAADGADGSGTDAPQLEPLDAAVQSLSPRRQIALARAFMPADPGTAGGAGLGLPLRALYETRDPGDSPPLQLRIQIDQDRGGAVAARGKRATRSRASGWGFALNAGLALLVLTLVIALASTMGVRASAVAGGDPVSDPATPLSIDGVSLLQGGIDGGSVHAAGTQTTLVATFPAAAVFHASPRDCGSDLIGVIDWLGQPTWAGARAGQTGVMAGDPSSPNAYVAGFGEFCQPSSYLSQDGGLTWASGSLPGDSTEMPLWLAFDPSHARTLLAYYPDRIFMSVDAGTTWTSRLSGVAPIAFDSTGRLVGWDRGRLYESLDDGATWQDTGAGPADLPSVAGATSNGVLTGSATGLWWYPLTSAPSLVKSGTVFSIATLGGGAVVLGADAGGHPWLGTADDSQPGISLATLPADASALVVTGGQVAVNDSGAVIAFSGRSSLIALATFIH